MDCVKLDGKYVEKPWGRRQLPEGFRSTNGERIGEIWFDGDDAHPLLVKYLFTSERLSVQVHPDDRQAQAQGLDRGKAECWYIVEAEPGATIALGFKGDFSREEVRAAALDGTIEQLLDWRPVRAGDFFSVEPGTVHAIGGGLALIEIQQHSDVTYRLYDYGRPRELHLDAGLAVARTSPYPAHLARHAPPDQAHLLVDGAHFKVALSHSDIMQDRTRWLLPLSGTVRCGTVTARPGECLLAAAGASAETDGAPMLVGSAV